MNTLDTILKLLCPLLVLLYAMTSALYLLYFYKRNRVIERICTVALAVSLTAHIAFAITRGIRYGRHPMASFFEIQSMVALSLAFVYFMIEMWRKNKSTGLFVMPLVLLLQTIAWARMRSTEQVKPILRDFYFGLHTGSVTLSYSAFFLSAVYGVMLLWFHRVLKRKEFGIIFERLPSLDVLARMNRGASLIGFLFMTVAIVTGLVWAISKNAGPLINVRIMSTFVVWAIFGMALLMHYGLKWANRRVAIVILAGFLFMVTSSAIVNAFVVDWHTFGAPRR